MFPGNDRPGILLAGAAQTYLNRYGVRVGAARRDRDGGRRGLPGRPRPARRRNGHRRHRRSARRARGRAAAGGPPRRICLVLPGSTVLGTEGDLRVRACLAERHRRCPSAVRLRCHVDVGRLHAERALVLPITRQARLERDPQCLRAGRIRRAGALRRRLPRYLRTWRRSWRTGRAPAQPQRELPMPLTLRGAGRAPRAGDLTRARCPQAATPARQKSFVDWQHDVTLKDVQLAAREGFQSIEHVKRYTTTGMATDQGKTSNMNALAIVSQDLSSPIPRVGLTTFRAPYTPTTFGSFAGISRGDLFDPVRTTPTHAWAAAQGAVFENVGTVEARALFSTSRRGHACRGRARMPRGAQCLRSFSTPRLSARSKSWARMPRNS